MPDVASDTTIDDWFRAHAQGAAKLARCVSLAACVEAELLRAARLRFCPDVGVEAEAEVWFSPLVESRSPTGVIFSAAALRRVWQDFPERSLLDDIRSLTRAYRSGVPAAVELEEEIAYWSLSQRADAAKEIDAALARLLATMLHPERRHFAMWAERALPRLQPLVGTNSRSALLQQAARERGATLPQATAAVPAWIRQQQEMRVIGLALVEGGLLFRDPAGTSDSHVEVPRGQPVRLLISRSIELSSPDELTLSGPLTHWATTWRPPFYVGVAGGDTWAIDRQDLTKVGTLVLLYGEEAPLQLLNDITRALTAADFDVVGSESPLPTGASTPGVLVFVTLKPSAKTWQDAIFLQFRQDCRHIVLVCDVLDEPPVGLPLIRYTAADPPDPTLPASLRWKLRFDDLIDAIRSSSDLPATIESVPALPQKQVELPGFLTPLRNAIERGPIIQLKGEDGSGRRTLASAAAHDCWWRRRFSGGIHWLSQPPGALGQGSKRLFVCDYPDASIEWLPENETGSVVMLTRDPLSEIPSAQVVFVPPLDERSALVLWAQHAALSDASASMLSPASPALEAALRNPLSIGTLAQLVNRHQVDGMLSGVKGISDYQGSHFAFRLVRELEPALLANGGFQVCAFLAEFPIPPWLWNEVLGSQADELTARLTELNVIVRMPDTSILVRKSASDELEASQVEPYHAAIVTVYERLSQADWVRCLQLHNDDYCRNALLYHLVRSGRREEALDMELDYDWIRNTTLGKEPHQLRYFARWSLTPDTTSLWGDIADELAAGTTIEDALLRQRRQEISGNQGVRRLRQRAIARSLVRRYQPRPEVLVAGLGGPQIPMEVVYASETLGRELARAGFALLSGGWPGVDHMVCREYVHELRRMEFPRTRLLTHVIPANSYPDLWAVEDLRGEGARDAAGSADESLQRSVERAQLVVIIGGMDLTRRIATIAQALGKPVFPIPGTGGVADETVRVTSVIQRIDGYAEAWRVVRKVVADLADHPAAQHAQGEPGMEAPSELPKPLA